MNQKPNEINITLKSSTWDFLHYATWGVINQQYGTGKLAKVEFADVYGKTGTAQNPRLVVHVDNVVEVFVNGNTMGVVKAAADGTFTIKRIILEEGENTVAAFARSESQLQSPLSPPKTYILD